MIVSVILGDGGGAGGSRPPGYDLQVNPSAGRVTWHQFGVGSPIPANVEVMEGLGPPQTGQLARNRLLHGGDVGCGVDEDPYVGVGLLERLLDDRNLLCGFLILHSNFLTLLNDTILKTTNQPTSANILCHLPYGATCEFLQ